MEIERQPQAARRERTPCSRLCLVPAICPNPLIFHLSLKAANLGTLESCWVEDNAAKLAIYYCQDGLSTAFCSIPWKVGWDILGQSKGASNEPAPFTTVHFLCTIHRKTGANTGKPDLCLNRSFQILATTYQPLPRSSSRPDLIRNHQVGGSSPPAGSKKIKGL